MSSMERVRRSELGELALQPVGGVVPQRFLLEDPPWADA